LLPAIGERHNEADQGANMKNRKTTLFASALLILAATIGIAAPVDGEWDLSLTAPEGATYFKMTIAIDGEAASGMVGEVAFNGSYKDGNLKLTGDYYVPEAGYNAVLDLDMRLDGEVLTGTATWDMYTADVLGKRSE
jgi:hypothetical protein